MYQEKEQESTLGASWRTLVLPFAIMALGTVLAFLSPAIGGIVVLIGFIWVALRSLPLALAVYVIASPFRFGLAFHHHQIALSDLMAIIMAIRLIGMSGRPGVRGLWQKFMGTPFWRPVALLLVLSILSMGVALSHSTTLVKILEYIEFFVVIVAVARQAGLTEAAWKPVLGALFAISSFLAVIGFYQFLFEVGPKANVVDHHHVRAEALFGQPNAFGGFEAMVFPLIVTLLAYGPSWARKWWAWVVTALVALSVIDSFSRGAWVASMAAVFFMGVVAWVSQGREAINRRFVIPAVILPIIGFVLIDLIGKTNLSHHALLGVISKRTTGGIISSTITAVGNPKGHFDTAQRLLIWKEALRAIKHHPILGVGLGGFHRFVELNPIPKLLHAPPMAHNLYLEWGADLGVLGIFTALWLEWSWIRHAAGALMSKARSLSRFEFALGLGAFGTMVSFIVHDWVDFMIDHGVVVPLLLAMAVVWALVNRGAGRSES